jgi:hypothetical protein
MAMDNVHEFVYFNPLLEEKKNITIPATTIRLRFCWLVPSTTMSMDDAAVQLKKISPFPRRRVDLERVGLCHRPIWPWTIAMNLFILIRRWTIKKKSPFLHYAEKAGRCDIS